MKEYDRVVLTVDKKEYAEMGLYKGMSGAIIEPFDDDDTDVIVLFDQYGPLPNIYDYAGIDRKDLRLQEISELEDYAHFVGAIYFPDLVNEDGYRTDGALLLVEKEEYARQGVHRGAYGQIVSFDGDGITVNFRLIEPKRTLTLVVKEWDVDYFGNSDYIRR